jgi:tRNA-dependent cyclodipeptide synthase
MSKAMIKVKYIYSNSSHQDFSLVDLADKTCYCGISLLNKNFKGNSLKELLAWIAANFKQCQIIIADELYRHNYAMFGMTEVEIANRIKADFEEYNHILHRHISTLSGCEFSVVRWREYFDTPAYHIARNNLDDLFRHNLDFSNSLYTTANKFLANQVKEGKIKMSTEQALTYSTDFLLEETAVLNCVVGRGYEVEIYPGVYLPLLTEIASGKYPTAPESLQKRISVEVQVKLPKNKK